MSAEPWQLACSFIAGVMAYAALGSNDAAAYQNTNDDAVLTEAGDEYEADPLEWDEFEGTITLHSN